MSKRAQIADVQAQRLQQLAATNGASESALVEQALKLLFRQSGREEALRADREALQQLEAAGVLPSPHQITPALHPAEYQLTHPVLVVPESAQSLTE